MANGRIMTLRLRTKKPFSMVRSRSFIIVFGDIEKERKRSANPDSIDEDEDEVAEIKAAHFDESMKYALGSVSDADIRKSTSLKQSQGFGSEFRIPEAASGAGCGGSDPFAASAGGADDDDLYN
ncbi:putative vesicle-fusing ATPase [Helianthus annuus]|nr:putative vesicle-fusing ATPase [Helianthus annuus]